MTNSKIRYSLPTITKKEISHVHEAIKTGWGDNCYNYIKKFENKFKKFLGVKYAIATSSCTGALHMGLDALNIKKGDEIILADTNWIATVSPIIHLKAKPIFVDINKDNWCIETNKIENKISKKTKAIIATHLYGNLCDIKKITQICKKNKIFFIEDSAEALGSKFNNKYAGTFGKFGVFSFHGSKTITTGEGGMFVTNDKKIYEKVLMLNNHGRAHNETKQFWSQTIGYKFKISNMQAALGYAQLLRINEILNKKKKIFNIYKGEFKNYPVSLNKENKNENNCFWMINIVFQNEKIKRKIYNKLRKKNIDIRNFFYPLSALPMFKKMKKNKNAYNIHKKSFNLPSYYDLKKKDQYRIIKIIKNELIKKN